MISSHYYKDYFLADCTHMAYVFLYLMFLVVCQFRQGSQPLIQIYQQKSFICIKGGRVLKSNLFDFKLYMNTLIMEEKQDARKTCP